MGPGLALLDETLEGEPDNVRFLNTYVGNHTLAASVGEVTRKALSLRGGFDEELVVNLHHAHLVSWSAYDEFIIRKRDRFGRASFAIRAARAEAVRLLGHWMRFASPGTSNAAPARYRPNALLLGAGQDVAFGLGYMAALTFTHMTSTSGRDPDDTLEELRASLAGECLSPPGPQSLA
ncbi:hypothetical protein [Curtobacterium sp. VKM Ac-1376]|uniref:hypothetical protein n=1 Tax=Curtobacterium sp. VKM Ac-1376 TaxID=123312 RepID=UPI00188B8E5F|nr:hypothetical protein [Curtobacterium sp. VKM Ac-1376]MBF4616205.1 hypothetical protein [Curtobacterium sp. VKM Ac-1376]